MSAHRGVIAGATSQERAVRLAGALAEMSQTRLLLRIGGAEVEVAARVTNLPGALVDEITRVGQVQLSAPGIGAAFELTPDSGSWECGEPSVAEQLRRKLQY
ncbi:MAG: hypothetical protein U0637_12805 [Phycisphaerales bacterium]